MRVFVSIFKLAFLSVVCANASTLSTNSSSSSGASESDFLGYNLSLPQNMGPLSGCNSSYFYLNSTDLCAAIGGEWMSSIQFCNATHETLDEMDRNAIAKGVGQFVCASTTASTNDTTSDDTTSDDTTSKDTSGKQLDGALHLASEPDWMMIVIPGMVMLINAKATFLDFTWYRNIMIWTTWANF